MCLTSEPKLDQEDKCSQKQANGQLRQGVSEGAGEESPEPDGDMERGKVWMKRRNTTHLEMEYDHGTAQTKPGTVSS